MNRRAVTVLCAVGLRTHRAAGTGTRRAPFLAWCLPALVLLTAALPARAADAIRIDPPGDREFVRDLAGVILPADEAAIRKTCDRLLSDKATPIVVVTIESMAKYGPEGLRIEKFAQLLFDQWGVGQAHIDGKPWNTGILLVVSRDDRKARIELGAGWGRGKDAQCQAIMDDIIVPQFKAGNFSGGILAGVGALDQMARGNLGALPTASGPTDSSGSTSWLNSCFGLGVPIIVIMVVVQFIVRLFGLGGRTWGRRTGWWYRNSGGWSSGGGGGSFGGGSSGGGGASGSW
jgi:uncharacterized protein